MPRIFAAGAHAARWVKRFPEDAAICAFDFGHASTAIYDMVARRRRGEEHDAILLLPEPRVALLAQLAPAFFAQNTDYDALISLFDGFSAGTLTISGQPQMQYLALDPNELLICRDALKLSKRVLFRSYAEYRRTCAALGWYPKRYAIAAPAALPQFAHNAGAPEGPAPIVIWSASESDDLFARVAAFAITGEFSIPVVVVSDTQVAELQTIRPTEAAETLRRAACIIDVSADDPSAAVMLAGFKRPVMAATTSGAEEFCEGLVLFDPTARKEIVNAVAAALGSAPPTVLEEGRRRAYIPAFADLPKPDGPLVSVIVPTFNRRADLEITLRSIAAQTYEHVEIIVVNDAGENVDDLVQRFENARAINRVENGGLAAARNDGIRAARGTFVALIDDDDTFFPEHVALLVDALERSGGSFARSNAVTRYVEPAENGRKRTFCYKMEMDLYASLTDLYVNNHFNSMVVMIRREIFERHGFFDETLPSTEDYEMWLRLAEVYPIVHVDYVTGEYTRLTDRSAMTYRLRNRRIDSFTQIYRTHAPADRPAIEQRREATLAWWTERDGIAPAEPSFRMADPAVTGAVDDNFTFGPS